GGQPAPPRPRGPGCRTARSTGGGARRRPGSRCRRVRFRGTGLASRVSCNGSGPDSSRCRPSPAVTPILLHWRGHGVCSTAMGTPPVHLSLVGTGVDAHPAGTLSFLDSIIVLSDYENGV